MRQNKEKMNKFNFYVDKTKKIVYNKNYEKSKKKKYN